MFLDLVQKIFTGYGYETEEHNGLLLAKKGSMTILIGINDARGLLSEKEITDFINSVKGKAEKFLFISCGRFSFGATKLAQQNNLILWDREKFEKEIGRIVLFNLEKGVGIIEEMPSSKEKEQEYHEESVLKPKINAESAIAIANKKIGQVFKYDLHLTPYFIFDYVCEVLTEGEENVEKTKGCIRVNALTLESEEWQFEGVAVPTIDGPYVKLEPKTDFEKAKKSAEEKIIFVNTRYIERVVDKGNITIIEKKMMKPKDDAIYITSKGILYVPVWCMEGTSGVMVIEATNGKIVREDIYTGKK